MKEEEEAKSSGEEPEKSVERTLEKINGPSKEIEIKGEVENESGHPPLNIPNFEISQAAKKNIERWTQNAIAIQKRVNDFQRKMNTIDFSAPAKKVQDFHLAMETGAKSAVQMTEKIQSILQTPNWESLVEASNAYRKMVERDEKLKKYASSSYFWDNLKLVSSKLISLPLKPTDALLEELAKADMSIDVVRELIEPFTEDELRSESQADVHGDYMFQNYLLKLLDSYRNHPEGYQLLIPSQFLILEGTLSETFRVDEKGMAGDIKKRMHLLWDILYALYSHHPINISASLYSQISLTNIKEMFEELTKNSGSAVRINRNGVLHGRSHPDDWLKEDFHSLTQLLYSSLYMRRTIDVMLEDLTEWSTAELLDTVPLKEYRETLISEVLGKVNKIRKSGQAVSFNDVQQRLETAVSKELKKILPDEKIVRNLVTLMNIKEIAEDPRFQEKKES